jgi:hypothetical protein
MERFWRTLREGCLDHLGNPGSLQDVQVRLLAFLGKHYHVSPHASLMGKTPAQVYETAPRCEVPRAWEPNSMARRRRGPDSSAALRAAIGSSGDGCTPISLAARGR